MGDVNHLLALAEQHYLLLAALTFLEDLNTLRYTWTSTLYNQNVLGEVMDFKACSSAWLLNPHPWIDHRALNHHNIII